MTEQKQRGAHPLLRYYGKLALTLLAVTAAAALLMSLVNALTADRIARQAQARRQAAMESVVPGADIFSQLPYDPAQVSDMQVAYRDGTMMGYCVEVSPDGFGGPISLMVGVDATGAVTGVSILGHSETAGVGTKVGTEEFLSRFVGLSGTVQIGRGGNSVDAASGATISSRAVARGVTDALAAVARFQAEGGMPVEEEGEV